MENKKSKKKIILWIVIVLSACILAVGGTGLGLYLSGHMVFEDGKIQFIFGDNTNNGEEEDNYTINLRLPNGTTEAYTYNPVSSTFNPSNIVGDYEESNNCEFVAWYTDYRKTSELSLTDLRDGMTLYAKFVNLYDIKIHSATPDSSASTYTTVTLRENTIFNIDDYISFTTSSLYGIYSNSSLTTEITSTFLVTGQKDIYLLWATPQADFTWTISGSSATITAYNGTASTVYIPKIIFYEVGENKTVAAIGSGAFTSASITKIEVPSTVTSMTADSFSTCSNLTNISVSSKSSIFSSLNGILFSKSRGTLIYAPKALSGTYSMPSTVTVIGSKAFYNSSFTSITLSSSLVNIGSNAFSNSLINTIEIPSTVTVIGENAFKDCTSLTSIKMLADIPPNLGATAFDGNCTIYVPTDATSEYSEASGWDTYSDSINPTTSDQSLFSWTTDGVEATVTSFLGDNSVTAVAIPSEYILDGVSYTVTIIGENAFSVPTFIQKIFLPDTITTIMAGAFRNCKSLIQVNIPDSVTEMIGADIFCGCSSLLSIEIPDGVTSLGSRIFSGCSSLANVTLSDNLTTILEQTFFECTSLTSITLPSSIISMGHSTFSGCSSLTSVVLSDNLTTIPNSTFYNCTSLTQIAIPSNIVYISSSAFSSCSALASITIPEGVTTLFSYTFAGCLSLTSVSLPDSLTTIQWNVFSGCLSLTSFEIPPNVSTISYGTFSGCTLLTNITISTSVTVIESNAFNDCSSLTSINIPQSVSQIDSSAFNNCSSLTAINVDENNSHYCAENGILFNIDKTRLVRYPANKSGVFFYTIPSTVKYISDNAFEGNTYLRNITIPSGVLSIGSYAFSGCTSLGLGGLTVTIPSTVSFIGSYAFQNCSSLVKMRYSSNVTNIYEKTFEGCTSLITLTDGYANAIDGITSISTQAFKDCTSLETLRFLHATYISDRAFVGCSSLTSITFGSHLENLGYAIFEDCSSLQEINISSTNATYSSEEGVLFNKDKTELILYPVGKTDTSYIVPSGVITIKSLSFEDCSFLTSITIADTVATIEYNAFMDCTSLSNVVIPSSVVNIEYNAFMDCTSLISVTILSNNISLGDSCFSGCTSLTSLIIESTNPPTLGFSVFYNIDLSSFVVYVPSEALETYLSSENWFGYYNLIQAIVEG